MKRPGVTGRKKIPSHLSLIVSVASSSDSQPWRPSSSRRGASSSPQGSTLACSILLSSGWLAAEMVGLVMGRTLGTQNNLGLPSLPPQRCKGVRASADESYAAG